jgi:hypothetical protein
VGTPRGQRDRFSKEEFAPLVGPLHKFASKVAWISNDIFFLQSAYEKVAQGMSLPDALKETGRIIPDYRLPSRILDSRFLSKAMGERKAFIFSPYHYGLLKSFPEMAKSAFGIHEPPKGRSKAGNSAAVNPPGGSVGIPLKFDDNFLSNANVPPISATGVRDREVVRCECG